MLVTWDFTFILWKCISVMSLLIILCGSFYILKKTIIYYSKYGYCNLCFLIFKGVFFFKFYIRILPTYLSVQYVCLMSSKVRKGLVGSLRTVVTCGWILPCVCRELNPAALQEQQMFLAANPSLQLQWL